jgi:hypothetical protein
VLEHNHDRGQIGGRGQIHAESSVCPCALGKHLYDHPPEIYGQSDQHHEGRGREGAYNQGSAQGRNERAGDGALKSARTCVVRTACAVVTFWPSGTLAQMHAPVIDTRLATWRADSSRRIRNTSI